jgi:hypothetical protein
VSPAGLTPVAELRAGAARRPPCGTLAAATDEASEGAKCSQRDAVQLVSPVPTNGPRVSSSAKLARRTDLHGDLFNRGARLRHEFAAFAKAFDVDFDGFSN